MKDTPLMRAVQSVILAAVAGLVAYGVFRLVIG